MFFVHDLNSPCDIALQIERLDIYNVLAGYGGRCFLQLGSYRAGPWFYEPDSTDEEIWPMDYDDFDF